MINSSSPSTWHEVKLKDLTAKIGSGITPRGGSDVFVNDGVMFIRSQNVKNGKVDVTDKKFITAAIDQQMSSSRVKKGDVLYNITGASIGRSAVYDIDDPANVNQHVCIVRLKRDSPSFINHVLTSDIGKRLLWSFQAGGNRQGLNFQQLGSFTFSIPDIDEQLRIVAVLETWDEYLDKLGEKIEIKKQIKKGLMQQLLTGKHRLSGFTDDWQVVEIGKMAVVIISNVDKHTSNDERPVYLCNYMDVYYNDVIDSHENLSHGTVSPNEYNNFVLKKNDVVITKDSETPIDIAKSCFISKDLDDVVCGYHLAIIRANPEKTNGFFMKKLLDLPAIQHYFFSLANGATRFGITKPSIQKACLSMPNIKEQDTISSILKNVDLEIKSLAKKREVILKQKHYLVSNLMSGKLRTENLVIRGQETHHA